MAYVWKHPRSSFWTAVYRDERNIWRKKTTSLSVKSKALAVALEWERAAGLGRERTLTESRSRELISGILERVSGDSIRAVTVREYTKEWLQGKVRAKQEGTSTRYAGSVTRFLSFLDSKADLPLSAISQRDCQRYHDALQDEGLAPASLRVEIKTVSSIFNAARRLGLVSVNPVNAVELPERIQQVKRKVFTPEQVQLLLDEAEGEWRTVILLAYYAGLRLSDAVSLTWDNADLAEGKLRIETKKTGQYLEIPMHPVLEEHLSKLAGDKGGAICPGLDAASVGGRSGLSHQFLGVMRKAGINNDSVKTGGRRHLSQLSFHALRASFNSALHNKGVDQEIRRKLTGHKSNAVNDRYTQTELATLRNAVDKMPTLKVS